ncbi:hypothetical protein ATY81_25425 [Rhizobium sp. R72]|uniref:hypothetical protein n=1 Tax=unclassified Rhizobium TaxID=2613769 RepID=UPI000B52F979|nr:MULTISPECIES: hypothetical protein [unclassified Rhizobium]OWW00136.1 hypothetical protein ATY81_25425 [Rhizobium sp. R72]OWW00527.1 hypothetical protein ATY80_25425 [Rhizobium sp. R711]
MKTNDTNATPEQKRPKDVMPIAEKPERAGRADQGSMAPPAVQRRGAKDESERPIVNPITGVAQ